jgi:Ca-activated chloride channel family protein
MTFLSRIFKRPLLLLLAALAAVFLLTLTGFTQSGKVKQEEPARGKITSAPPVAAAKTPAPTRSPSPTPKPTPDYDDGEVLRIESILIPIPVSVTDAQGRAVADLKLADFKLSIDDAEQELSEMTRSETPIRLAMLFDNSSSVIQAREFEKKAAVRFFRQVIRPQKDLAALFSVSTATRLEQPLTKNVSQLTDAIERFALPDGATALLDGIVKASEYLKDVTGRRVIVIVSDGEDNVSDSTLEQAVRAAHAANCQVYVVKTTDFENYKRTGSRLPNANTRVLDAERRMQELAQQTGGAVYSPLDDKELDAAFTQISAELSQQYILSYYPAELKKDGLFRKITLRVPARAGATVRTRKGFYAPRPKI